MTESDNLPLVLQMQIDLHAHACHAEVAAAFAQARERLVPYRGLRIENCTFDNDASSGSIVINEMPLFFVHGKPEDFAHD